MSWKTPPTPNALIDNNSHATSDAVLIVETKNIDVHKSYLSLVSPVFKAMFDHPTTEAKTGRVTITDFSYDVVKAAVDYIYGVPLGDDSIDKILDVYRFVDKYDINAARKQLTKCIEEEVTNTNFCTIAKFAWTYSNEHILKKCVAFLASHGELAITKDFNELDGRLILELLRKASDFTFTPRRARLSRYLEPTTCPGTPLQAWIYSDEYIMSNCVNYLAKSKDLVFTSKFQDLDQSLITELLRRTKR